MPNAVPPIDAKRAERSSSRGLAVVAIWFASAVVLLATLSTAFRVAPGAAAETLLRVQGPRVLLAAGAGALLALAGAIRAPGDTRRRPLLELEGFALSVGAAAGGFAAANALPSVPALVAFAIGAALGGALGFALARALDRPRRAVNFGVLALLAAGITAAALAGTYARARRDAVAPIVAWLLGDLGGATIVSGLVLVAVAVLLVWLALRALAAKDVARSDTVAWVAAGLAIGSAGPLAFVGGMVPRAVRWLAPEADDAAALATSALAGAATVAAIDAVPRLLVGGYDFPFNVPAALLAIPIYVGWNRTRLRREAGPAPRWLEALELAVIVVATLAAAALAAKLVAVVRSAT